MVLEHGAKVFEEEGKRRDAKRTARSRKTKGQQASGTGGKGLVMEGGGEGVETAPLWGTVLNRDEVSDKKRDNDKRGTRYISHRKMFHEAIEAKPEMESLVKSKALLDVRLAIMALKLGVIGRGEERCKIPATGGRLLASAPGCPRQLYHVDHDLSHLRGKDTKVLPASPGGFALCTGAEGDDLWVVPRSHFGLHKSDVLGKDFGPGYEAIKISIPPYSVVFVRGDCVHAGAEVSGSDTRTRFRYHLYFMPHGVVAVNAITRTGGFRHGGHDGERVGKK